MSDEINDSRRKKEEFHAQTKEEKKRRKKFHPLTEEEKEKVSHNYFTFESGSDQVDYWQLPLTDIARS